MLIAQHHNFTLIWQTELPKFCGLPTTASSPPDFTVTPQPWLRTGPGTASDGKLKFDLTRNNQAYFGRLRARVRQLQAAGIYAGVYLFSGEWLLRFRCPSDGYPFTGSNNVNGIDDGGGIGSVTMTATNAITEIQDAYVKKVIETLNDLPNVLWIISQEAPPNSVWWKSRLIALIRSYEVGKPLQHPIGYGVLGDVSGTAGDGDALLVNSDPDWIAPATKISPTSSCGGGNPRCKVNINDSDHSYFGMWNDSAELNRNYFWINFTQGDQTVFMDPYVVYYPRENRNLSPSPVKGISPGPDPRWEPVRDTIGYIREYADRINLAAMTPQGSLTSTGHALAGINRMDAELLVSCSFWRRLYRGSPRVRRHICGGMDEPGNRNQRRKCKQRRHETVYAAVQWGCHAVSERERVARPATELNIKTLDWIFIQLCSAEAVLWCFRRRREPDANLAVEIGTVTQKARFCGFPRRCRGCRDRGGTGGERCFESLGGQMIRSTWRSGRQTLDVPPACRPHSASGSVEADWVLQGWSWWFCCWLGAVLGPRPGGLSDRGRQDSENGAARCGSRPRRICRRPCNDECFSLQ
jgi:hypothetical protein